MHRLERETYWHVVSLVMEKKGIRVRKIPNLGGVSLIKAQGGPKKRCGGGGAAAAGNDFLGIGVFY